MSSSNKRERELERQKAVRQAAKLAEEKSRRRRLQAIIGAVIAAVVVIGAGVWAISAANSDDTTSTASAPTPSTSPSSDTATKKVACAKPSATKPLTKTYPDGPNLPANLDPSIKYGLDIATNCGSFKINLDVKNAPELSKSFIFLANTGADVCRPVGADCGGTKPTGKATKVQGYFDYTSCHRLTTAGIFVLQCGDPTGTGSGTPGYELKGENFPTAEGINYPRGTVAMANANNRDGNGSQFFIVYKDSTLSPDYAIVGYVSEGMSVIDKVAKAGTISGKPDGAPKQPLQFTKVTSFQTTEVAAPAQ